MHRNEMPNIDGSLASVFKAIMTSRLQIVCLLMTSALALLQPGAGWAQTNQRRAEISDGIFVLYPDRWTASKVLYRNAVELVIPSGEPKAKLPLARLLAGTEQRRDHADAVRRLAEIAVELSATARVFAISGWPAIERRYLAPPPRYGDRVVDGAAESGEALAIWTTTAIAVGDLIVRADATVTHSSDTEFADQAQEMGRNLVVPKRDEPQRLEQEIQQVRDRIGKSAPEVNPQKIRLSGRARRLPPPVLASKAAAVFVSNGVGELEIATANDGQNVVIAANSGISFSNNGGGAFNLSGGNGSVQNIPGGADGDLSVAFGQNGRFYISFIHFPNPNNSVGIAVSTNNGQNFIFQTDAILCQPGGCSVDQPHIAADHFNSGTQGNDRVYVVWRIPSAIACSSDGRQTWSQQPVALMGGDFPRLTVGPDGEVYAVFRPANSSAVMLYKFAPCTNANAIVPEAGFPVQVATVNDNICPVSGLDRCNAGTIAPSPMVAVDDTNPSHVYVAFASTSVIGNDDIWVFDSTNGGANFARSVKVSPTVPAHRFLPWVCATGGAAIVSWYDRSRATAQRNDLTDYLVASASVQGGVLTSGPAVNVSQNSDPQCATGFPCGADVDDKPAVACVPPQIIGRCRNAQQPAASSNQACSIVRGTVCPNLGETCQMAGNGCPKYGDYNGNACGGGYIYTAWATATSPPGIPAVNGIAIFSTTLTQTLTLNTVVVGGAGLFDLQIDGFNQAVNVGNGGSTGPKVVSIGTHTIGEIAGFGTSASNYSVTIGGDCSPNGIINITLGDHKTCTLTNTKISLESCLQQCLDEYADCVEGGDLIGGGSVAKCRPILARCRARCRRR